MPAANHSFYLRNCYLENKLVQGPDGDRQRAARSRQGQDAVYNLATREDHIAPAKSVFLGSKFFGGPVKFVLAGSGHIAGVVNPPGKPKYQYWTGDDAGAARSTTGSRRPTEHPGSWWPDWLEWIKAHGDDERPGARAGRRQAQADRGRAGQLREGEG